MWAEYFSEPEPLIRFILSCCSLVISVAALSIALQNRIGTARRWDPRSRFNPGQIVITRGELNYSHGNGQIVPGGTRLRLRDAHATNHGVRWSASWNDVHVYPIPEDMLESLDHS